MEREKIYYAVAVLVSAVSVLISPFFYVRRERQLKNGGNQTRHWRVIAASSLITVSALLAVWWFWLRQSL